MTFPKQIKIVEVGPRDGLQNEPKTLPTAIKIEFINQLSKTGLSVIEATSFVSPQWIPQLADHTEVLTGIIKEPGISYPVLVPNLEGFESALAAGAREIAIFTAVSETFCHRNINCSIAESLERYSEVTHAALQHNIRVRGYISCALGCPFEGEVSSQTVALVAEQLHQLGCYEISLGDTIGVSTPRKSQAMVQKVLKYVPTGNIAVHFHDTYGQALTNIYACMELGVATVDSAIAGLGGCPYAKGASGNVATEDVVYMLNGMGIETGINIEALLKTSAYVCEVLGIKPRSKAANALLLSGQSQHN